MHDIVDGQCANCDYEQPLYVLEGDYIYFGEFPQTVKAEDVEIYQQTNDKGYFKGSDGAWYAKIVAVGNGYSFSDWSDVIGDTVYYFKVEPLKWRILSESEGVALILCESVITYETYGSSNNYELSNVRAWLNNEFYNNAFNSLQKEIILTTLVENSSYFHQDHNDTEDKVFILSEEQAKNTNYFTSNDARKLIATDYARAKGVTTSSGVGWCGTWWLRTTYDQSNDKNFYVYGTGGIGGGDWTVTSYPFGIVPALRIQL